LRAHWLTFFRVMQKLMAEKIVLRTRYKAHRTLRKQAGRVNLKIEDVTVVELRRRSEKSESENGGSQREYSHQWVVRGFWRWQYYPASGTHKQKYIASHVRGPKDKPLIVKKRVWVWDR
jgi:hypothetical protein